jgi:hypothetical protein
MRRILRKFIESGNDGIWWGIDHSRSRVYASNLTASHPCRAFPCAPLPWAKTKSAPEIQRAFAERIEFTNHDETLI